MPLTEEQKQNYVKHPNTCPYCGSDEIDVHHIEAQDDGASGHVHCRKCDKRWLDCYELTDIVEVEN